MEKEQIESDGPQRRPSLIQPLSEFHPLDIIALMDKNLLQSIENIYRLKEDGLDPLQFTRFFMNCIEHQQSQNAYLAAGLSELFQIISNGRNRIKFSQITDYICQHIVEGEDASHELQAKWISIKGNRQTYLRQPPTITGRTQQIYKVWLDKDLLDNGKHQDAINHACYSQGRNRIYSLQSLADWIGIYTSESKLEKKLKPSCFRAKKDSAIISISFSQRQQRLGAILKDFSISFWDANDNYTFQKSINTTKYCQEFQNQIWYLEFFQKWVTSDLQGKLYIWDLQGEKPQKIIKCKHRAKISDICEIPSVSLIAVAQQQKGGHTQSAKIQLISLTKGAIVSEIDTRFQRRMLHTIKYSQQYQVLLSAGYQKKINMFEINNVYLDSSLKGQLLGHQSAVTCFNLIKKTPMVVSADDRGKVKIWNIKNFKCMQTLDFTDKVSITKILDMGGQKKIALMGSRIIMLNLQNRPENIQEVTPIKTQLLSNSLLAFTGQDIRKIDLKTGKLQSIDLQFSKAISEVTSIIVSSKGQMVTGNDKGEISFYCKTTGKLKQTQLWHSGPVQQLLEDTVNGLILSYSIQSGFIVIGKPYNKWEQVRQLKCNFTGRELHSIVLSSYHSLICFISSRTVFVFDYQQLKIYDKLIFEDENPICLSLINGLSLLLIATSKGTIYVYQLQNETVKPCILIRLKSLPITRLVTDIQCHQIGNKQHLDFCNVACAFADGSMQTVDLTSFAKTLSFKSSRNDEFYCNPHRQVRQNFDNQMKKFHKEERVQNSSFSDFQGTITSLSGHASSITSLMFVETDQHFLVSTGKDQRIKIWKQDRLVGDININLPLPYLWKVELSEETSEAKRVMRGLELIQMIFKRFGKDISIGQSQLFKTSPLMKAVSRSFLTSLPNTKRKLKKKPTLFQEEFTPVDLHYERIKKENLLQVGGPSLKRMQVSKKVSALQRQWKIVKQRQQKEKNQLIENIFYKAQRNEQKDTILTILKDKHNLSEVEKPKEEVGTVKALQQKLDGLVEPRDNEHRYSNMNSPSQQSKEQLCKYIPRSKNIQPSNSKRTLQTYFNQRFSSGRQTAETVGTRSVQISPRVSKHEMQPDFCCEINYKKQSNFRIMLKQMRQKLSKSKNRNSEMLSSCEDLSATTRDFKNKRKYKNNSQIMNELDHQITTFRFKKV